MNTPSPSEETLFAQALARPAAERSAYLDQACAGNATLRERVKSLLHAQAEAGSLLEGSPGRDLGTMLAGSRAEEAPGDRIGRYKLLQRIGEGGCGVVYMAEQEEPVRRRVALKVIKLGMDTKSVVARFEAERQALAMMDHPNIAKVFDAGATDAGRPFFVMELVRGVPITKYCDEANLSTAARLELFTQVCHAIQHAHQKGIIHRDIKPSNVLVTVNDGKPVPKVIDFGIAKATQGRLTDATLFTAFEQFIGTPAYMSPEQAAMTSLDIDTRSDIYSLGVLLYEMLTGRPPFDPKTFLEAGLDEMRRIIREVEPPKPSTRLSTLTDVDRNTVAKLRGSVPAQLSTVLKGDLDWIVMRCLEKDRTRRYESAGSLAADLLRHLNDEPVTARPPSKAYLVQKLLRRHRIAFATGAAIALALVVGTGVATWQAIRATHAEQTARKQAQRSERVAMALKQIFGEIGPIVMRGEDTKLLRAMLDESVRRFPKEFEHEPEVLADVFGSIAQAYFELPDIGKWRELSERRLEIIRSIQPVPLFYEVDALGVLAHVRIEQGQLDSAEALASEALKKAERLGADRESKTEEILSVQADLLDARGQSTKALAIKRDLLGRKRHRLGSDSLEVASYLLLVQSHEINAGNFTESEAMRREALAIRRRQLPDGNPEVAEAALRMAEMLSAHGQYHESAALVQNQLDHMPKPPTPELWRWIEGLNGHLALLQTEQKNYPAAVAICREQLAFARATFSPNHLQFALSLIRLGNALRKNSEYAEAERVAREEIAFWERLGDVEPVVGTLTHASAVSRLTRSFLERGDTTQAEEIWRPEMEKVRKLLGSEDVRLAQHLALLAEIRAAQGSLPDAITLRRQILDLFQRNPKRQAGVPTAQLALAAVLITGTQFAEAESMLTAAWQMESTSIFFRFGSQRNILEKLVTLYEAWGAADATKFPLAAEWQSKLKNLNQAAAAKNVAPK